jgi:hypothetical protein
VGSRDWKKGPPNQRHQHITPGGLIRPHQFSWPNNFLFQGITPESILEWLVKRRMGGGGVVKRLIETNKTGDENSPMTRDELKGNRDPQF